jgi:hypothetical protein
MTIGNKMDGLENKHNKRKAHWLYVTLVLCICDANSHLSIISML